MPNAARRNSKSDTPPVNNTCMLPSLQLNADNGFHEIIGQSRKMQEVFDLVEKVADCDSTILLNGETVHGNKEASINELALAAAARVYASLVDRIEGSAKFDLNPEIEPDGWIDEIVHSIDNRGRGSTKIASPDRIPELPLASYFDSSTRAVIFREVQPD